jgi:hypothetical protein
MVNYEKKFFEEIIKGSINYVDVCRHLNIGTTYGNRQTIKKYIDLYNLDVSHFYTPIPKNHGDFRPKDLFNEILVENSTYSHTSTLKNKLYKIGLKKRECELCGQGEEWKGKKMSLILDHINGHNRDNRLENLRIVCPNCNATLDTHGGKNKTKNKKQYFCDCGNEISKRCKICVDCAHKEQRKVKERPNLEKLLIDVENIGYSKCGLKYGVSDNCIRKWIKQYNHIPPKKNGLLVK